MGIPGRRHHAKVQASARTNFTCTSCGHRARATARAEGTGSAKSVLFLEPGNASRAARTRAENDALNRAELLLSIARCPSCHERGRAAVAGFVAISVLGGIGIAVLGLFAGAMLWRSFTGVVLGGIIGVVAGVIYVWRRQELWRRADSNILFQQSGTSAAEPAALPADGHVG